MIADVKIVKYLALDGSMIGFLFLSFLSLSFVVSLFLLVTLPSALTRAALVIPSISPGDALGAVRYYAHMNAILDITQRGEEEASAPLISKTKPPFLSFLSFISLLSSSPPPPLNVSGLLCCSPTTACRPEPCVLSRLSVVNTCRQADRCDYVLLRNGSTGKGNIHT